MIDGKKGGRPGADGGERIDEVEAIIRYILISEVVLSLRMTCMRIYRKEKISHYLEPSVIFQARYQADSSVTCI